MKNTIWLLVLLVIFISACNSETNQEPQSVAPAKQVVLNNFEKTEGLDKIWYQGKAEVNRFKLLQNRYREVHPGEAVLIFVTEDFLTDAQVKNDNYSNPNSTPILKTNLLRKFTTGLYDYSIMTSVFTPVQTTAYPNTLKVTSSSQDWCGHTYMQLNQKKEGLQIELRSYFESEGDLNTVEETAIVEDEIFNRIRMNPDGLPSGQIKIYPSTTHARLAHKSFKPLDATASLKAYSGETFEGENLKVYEINYPQHRRSFSVVFESVSPYAIVGWEEKAPSVFDGQIRTTTAIRTHSDWIAYWGKNSRSDEKLRMQLGLEAIYE